MAPKAGAAKPATPKPPDLFPAIESGVEDDRKWEVVDVLGTRFKVRQVGVDESDAAYDASENENGTFNPRLQQRLELVASVTDPKITIDDIGRWPLIRLRALLYVMNRLNSLPPADESGNA